MTGMKVLRSLVLSSSMTLGASAGVVAGLNYLFHHNKDYTTLDEERHLKKMDGLFNHTEIVLYPHAVKVDRFSLFGGNVMYRDEDSSKIDSESNSVITLPRDGKVDSVYISRSYLTRNKYGERYPEIFENADKEFAAQLERFGLSNSN